VPAGSRACAIGEVGAVVRGGRLGEVVAAEVLPMVRGGRVVSGLHQVLYGMAGGSGCGWGQFAGVAW
jgi:hypothetical protein